MINQFYSARHHRQFTAGPETEAEIAARAAHIRILQQAHDEMTARFGQLTPENVREAIDFQSERIRTLTAHHFTA